jgi:DnaJ-class molecular chaperone
MADSRDRDYYADLGLTQRATTSDIKTAFHTLAKQHHPDKSGDSDTSAFRQAREAYEKLTDATFRTAYDADYCCTRMHCQTASDEGLFETRTATFEAELREQEAR